MTTIGTGFVILNRGPNNYIGLTRQRKRKKDRNGRIPEIRRIFGVTRKILQSVYTVRRKGLGHPEG